MVENVLYSGEPSWRIVPARILRNLLAVGLFLVVFLILYSLKGFSLAAIVDATGISLAVFQVLVPLALFLYIFYTVLLWKTFRYRITNRGVYFEGGIFIKQQKFVPLIKITDVLLSQNIIDQLLGIATIHLQTPGQSTTTYRGTQKAEVSLVGLTAPEEPKRILLKLLKTSQGIQ